MKVKMNEFVWSIQQAYQCLSNAIDAPKSGMDFRSTTYIMLIGQFYKMAKDVARSNVQIDSLKRRTREDGFQTILVLWKLFIKQIIPKINLRINYKI